MYHKPKVSVIIPAFNSQDFIQKAFDSAKQQTLQEIEIILVDDGSIDKTFTLLQHYKMEDNRVEVVQHSKNKGLGEARNSGIDKATGEYLFFLDSDDYIHPNTLEVMYEKAKEEDLDILQAQYIKHKGNVKEIFPKNLVPFSKGISGLDYYLEGILVCPQAPAKLWKASFVKSNNLRFDTGYYEDLSMVHYAFSIAEKVNNLIFPGYHYIDRKQSITGQQVTEKHISDYMQAIQRLQQLFMHDKLISNQSSLSASFGMYLVTLCLMVQAMPDKVMCNEVRQFEREMLKKYGKYIRKNKNLPFAKRFFITQKPCWYAKFKALKK